MITSPAPLIVLRKYDFKFFKQLLAFSFLHNVTGIVHAMRNKTYLFSLSQAFSAFTGLSNDFQYHR